MENEKLDLLELNQSEFQALAQPVLVDIKSACFLTIEGCGEPGGAVFQRRVGALFAVAYAIKMASKKDGRDYKIAPLEGLWWGSRGPGDFAAEPPEEWNWKLMIRTPDFVSEQDRDRAALRLLAKGKDADVRRVRLEEIHEGLCVQMLHVGPYSEERSTLAALSDFVEEQGLSFHGLHHEIYLSDPNRVAPEKLRTILRLPVVR